MTALHDPTPGASTDLSALGTAGPDAVRAALGRAVDRLFAAQSEAGWWKGELETNVTMDAEDLFLREFLGIGDPRITAGAANWIRSQQRDDGTWATFFGGPAELSTTVEAYWALKLAGDPVDAPHMHKAAAYIVAEGGVERTRVFTRIWMALFGLWPWEELPALPPEVILLPHQVLGRRVPLNIYDFACWARQTVVPLTVVGAHRPVRPMRPPWLASGARFDLDELRTGATRKEAEPRPARTLARAFQHLDRVLHLHERRPIGPLRRRALRKAERWIVERQEADGSWGGIQPPWVYSLLALHLQGYALDHPVMQAGLAGLDAFTIWDHSKCGQDSRCRSSASASERPEVRAAKAGGALAAEASAEPACQPAVHAAQAVHGVAGERHQDAPHVSERSERPEVRAAKAGGALAEPAVHAACVAGERRLEACQSPVWDTALAVVALTDAGVDSSDPRLARAAEWLLDEEVTVAGDWAVKRPALEPGGWAFEFENDNYPDVDDTAEVVLALDRVRRVDPVRVQAAIDRAVRWTNGMQCRDGGWGAFDVDNDSRVAAELPFCDFGAVTDPPSADVTAHAVEMLAHLCAVSRDHAVDRTALDRAIEWLSREQEPDGSWFGRWGANHLYGTGAAVPALVSAGVSVEDDRVQRAMRWLESAQNDDGGWGEDLRSYADDGWRARGESTASQTAWALLARAAARDLGESTRRGVTWLVETQRADGSWDEPYFTGTGFPRDFYINYHLYRLVFPVMALGRYLKALGALDG